MRDDNVKLPQTARELLQTAADAIPAALGKDYWDSLPVADAIAIVACHVTENAQTQGMTLDITMADVMDALIEKGQFPRFK